MTMRSTVNELLTSNKPELVIDLENYYSRIDGPQSFVSTK